MLTEKRKPPITDTVLLFAGPRLIAHRKNVTDHDTARDTAARWFAKKPTAKQPQITRAVWIDGEYRKNDPTNIVEFIIEDHQEVEA